MRRSWISRIHRRTATSALAASVLLVLGVVAMPSARAQTLVVLHTFTGGVDGYYPYAGLIQDAAGNLYGTTFWGGAGAGVVFKLDPTGKETVLHSFMGSPADGGFPQGGVVMDAAGNLYG